MYMHILFLQDIFKNLENEADEDYELDQMVEQHKRMGGKLISDVKKNEENLKAKHESSSDEEDEDETADTDTEIDFQSKKNNSKAAAGGKAEFEIVAKDEGK